MSYELREDEPLGDGIRRIVCRQVDGALQASNAKQNGKGSPVHETRKHLKKARSALRLAAGEINRNVLKREDRRLRNVGRLISEVRDAEVRLETVRQLRKLASAGKQNFRETEELLAFELDSFLAAFSEWPQEAKQKLTHARNRIGDWPLEKLDCRQLRKSVQKTYKRGRRALRKAKDNPNTKNLHAFRKRAKELWYQVRILRPLHPVVFKELNDELKTIGQYLGHTHDLAFVAERLSSIGSHPGRKRGGQALISLIDSRQEEIEQTALALGERFYAERARRFAKRLVGYFSEWELTRRVCPAKSRLETAALWA